MASLKTGIVLMVALAVASIVGTLFQYEKSLDVVFYSWWFRLILLALAANLVFCTYQTLAQRVLPSFRAPFPKSREFYAEGPLRFGLASSRTAEEVESILKQRGYSVVREGESVRARKGLLRLFAPPMVHTGMVVMLLGAFASAFVAFNGHVRLVEGETTASMEIGGEKPEVRPLGFRLRCLDFETGTFPQTQIPSRFISTVRIEDGDRQFTDTIEVNKSLDYRGLRFHQSGFGELRERARYRVAVVNSATSKAVEMAATAGTHTPIPGWDRDLFLQQSVAGVRYLVFDQQKIVASGSFERDISSLQIKAVEFVSDFVIGPDGKAASRSQTMNNPALRIAWVQEDQVLSSQWLFMRPELRGFSHGRQFPTRLELVEAEPGPDGVMEFHLDAYDGASNASLGHFSMRLHEAVALADLDGGANGTASDAATTVATAATVPGDCEVRVLGTEPLYYTDLAVSHNPMIPVIYFGAILACVGTGLALYMRRTTLWVKRPDGEGRLLAAVQYAPERAALTPGVQKTLAVLKG